LSLHLIHPVLVHFAVGFLVVGGLAEAAGIFRGRPAAERFGATAALLGVGFLVITVATGFLAANSVRLPAGAYDALEDHERAGLVLLGVWLLLVLWKAWYRGALPERQRALLGAALLAAAGFTLWVAYLGGHLVYGHGVGVNPGTAP
jgi:uncharacterized membrane protein